MMKLLIYLLESGLCLAALFGIYWIFLRKDTNFRMNRFYLIAAFIVSFTIPLAGITINSQLISEKDNTYNRLIEIKSYYARLISLIDPEFWQENREQTEQNESLPEMSSTYSISNTKKTYEINEKQ